MHIVMYGPEGSGKGTQATLLSKHYSIPVITSGDLVRDAAKQDTGITGQACRIALTKGQYVSDKLMYLLWKGRLASKEAKEGFILDGFPRTINQAKFLLAEVERYGYSIDRVIYLFLDENESKKRLMVRKRQIFEGSSINHDDPERVEQRLREYKINEVELLPYFENKGIMIRIDASKTVEEISRNIIEKLQDNIV